MSKKKIISIVGPTASGKSDLAFKIAEKYNLSIVNSDSKLLYRDFNIGTAKPSENQMKKVKHYMIDLLNHNEVSNLVWFLENSRKIINDLESIPILVGGTGQYTWGIIEGWDPPKIKPNFRLRNKLEKEISEFGINQVIQKYSTKYPLKYNKDLQNPRRLVRIIERYDSGYNDSSKRRLENHNLRSLIIGINIDRKTNDQLIKLRIQKMIESGWIDEVKQLLENGVKKNAPAMSSIGYREVISYLDQELDKNQMIKKIFSSTRKLMRHQDNWFKKSDKRIKWVDFDNSFEQADNIISMWLSKN
tara:strand:+ start:19374 stop:20282 length:909 start_codon:yes stop_codon:yes gene_type:complete